MLFANFDCVDMTTTASEVEEDAATTKAENATGYWWEERKSSRPLQIVSLSFIYQCELSVTAAAVLGLIHWVPGGRPKYEILIVRRRKDGGTQQIQSDSSQRPASQVFVSLFRNHQPQPCCHVVHQRTSAASTF